MLAGDTIAVSSFNSGTVVRVTPGGAVLPFASVTNEPRTRLQYIVAGRGGELFVPSFGHNRVYRIGPDGSVRVLVGTGARGGRDGPALEAEFDGPNSIVRLPGGDLVVTEYTAAGARLISLGAGPVPWAAAPGAALDEGRRRYSSGRYRGLLRSARERLARTHPPPRSRHPARSR